MPISYQEAIKNRSLKNFEKVKTMYDPQKAKEKAVLPTDSIVDGVIIKIDDGTVEDFVHNIENWKGSLKQRAISVHVEVNHNGRVLRLSQVYTYDHEDGFVIFTARSNLGKFKRKYGKLPEVGDQVKVITDSEGFGKIKID
jgi:hypothetical protein